MSVILKVVHRSSCSVWMLLGCSEGNVLEQRFSCNDILRCREDGMQGRFICKAEAKWMTGSQQLPDHCRHVLSQVPLMVTIKGQTWLLVPTV